MLADPMFFSVTTATELDIVFTVVEGKVTLN
jgi:hypothetical protein